MSLIERTVSLGGIDLRSTLRPLAILPGDPTVRLTEDSFARATLTPDGPGEIAVRWDGDDARISTWGEGGAWLATRADSMLGLTDDPTSFAPDGSLLAVWRRHHRTRLAATGTVWHDLAALIPQQRIRFIDAAHQWKVMTNAWGEPGPGPNGLRLPPDPTVLARRSYVELHSFGIERSRAQILINAAKVASRLHRCGEDAWVDAAPRLAAIRGVGPWTLGGLQATTWGDPDTVIAGDIGFPGMVGWFFERNQRADDQRMLELLERWRPNRYRVLRLIMASGDGPPRRHHRLARNPIEGR